MKKFKRQYVKEILLSKTKRSTNNNMVKNNYLGEQLSDLSSCGLKGGSPIETKPGSCLTSNDLQLINRGSDCFVNSVIQLLRCTDYFKFIKNHLPYILANTPPDSYKLSRRLRYIYDEESLGRPISVAFIIFYTSVSKLMSL